MIDIFDGLKILRFDTVFAGDVPLGAGMSSSAALESTFAFTINDLFNLVKADLYDAFITKAKAAFAEKYGHEPVVIPVVISDGARRL